MTRANQNQFVRPASSEQRRVVITGVGIICPTGLTLKDSWENVVKGISGIDRIQSFDPTNFDTQIAGEIKNFNIDDYVPKKEQKKMDRFIHLALATTKQAFEDANLTIAESHQHRAGALFGVGIGGLPMIERQYDVYKERGPSRLTPFFIPAVISNMTAGHMSMTYGLKGPNFTITSACASGAHAIGEAAKYIRSGLCDVMVAGGAESTVCPMAIGGFGAMKALSTRNSHPQQASRPWDRDRDGFVLAEGSATLILEDYEYASKRGAKIYAEVCGYGVSSDAYHMTSPSPGGVGAATAMTMALKDANVNSDMVDYINAHGTSTPAGDEIETEAIKRVFKDHAKKLCVSSTKSMTGHCLGAAGSVESVFSIMALNRGIAPPTINLDHPSEGCDLDYVAFTAQERKMSYTLNNSFGFGGTNASLLFGRV